VPSEFVPDQPIERIAGIVGPDMDVADGIDHGAVRVFTIWGEIAYQLGGEAGYQVVRASDEQRVAPGTQVWEKLIGDQPALIMIDEIAYYLRVARGAKYQVGTTSLADQTVAFLMSLIKFAAESPRTVLVGRPSSRFPCLCRPTCRPASARLPGRCRPRPAPGLPGRCRRR